MKPIEDMTDDEFRVHVSEIVSRELGLDGFARFIRLYHSGRGDYTRDRHQWLDGVTQDQVQEQTAAKALVEAA